MNTAGWKPILIDYAETDEYKNKIKQVKAELKNIIRDHKSGKLYVAYSGGKDSTVMTHLILQELPEIMIYHWNFGRYVFPEYLETELLENLKLIGGKNIRVETSVRYETEKWEAKQIFCIDFMVHAIRKLYNEGYTGSFIGLRAEESCGRKRRVKEKISLTKIKEYHIVGFLTWKDIWAYIFSNDLPYCSHYDKYSEFLDLSLIRMCTFFDPYKNSCMNTVNTDNFIMWRNRNL